MSAETEAVKREVGSLVERWMQHHRRVFSYVEPTVQLLQREAYSQVSSVWMFGCDLLAVCSNHLLVGYVSVHEWPTAEEIELIHGFRAPAGTRKVIFRWHRLTGFPDRRRL
jgi:hypothetical protein